MTVECMLVGTQLTKIYLAVWGWILCDGFVINFVLFNLFKYIQFLYLKLTRCIVTKEQAIFAFKISQVTFDSLC